MYRFIRNFSFHVNQSASFVIPRHTLRSRFLSSAVKYPEATRLPKDGEELPQEDILYRCIKLDVLGNEPAVLDSYEKFVTAACSHLNLKMQCETRNRPEFDRLSLNSSPFIFKKHQIAYEMRTHYKVFQLTHLTGCTADVILEYLQRNLPEGVAMHVTRHLLEKVPEELFEEAVKN